MLLSVAQRRVVAWVTDGGLDAELSLLGALAIQSVHLVVWDIETQDSVMVVRGMESPEVVHVAGEVELVSPVVAGHRICQRSFC